MYGSLGAPGARSIWRSCLLKNICICTETLKLKKLTGTDSGMTVKLYVFFQEEKFICEYNIYNKIYTWPLIANGIIEYNKPIYFSNIVFF